MARYTSSTHVAHHSSNYETTKSFWRVYRRYELFRDQLHTAEQKQHEETAKKLLAVTLKYKERLASYADELYQRSPSLDIFEKTILQLLTSRGKSIDILPLSLRDNKLSSPAASILATISNLKTAEEITRRGMKNADSVLLSGSTAWGSFYAVRAKLTVDFAGDIQLEERSDVDLLVVVGTTDALLQIVTDLWHGGCTSESEVQRCQVFLTLREARRLNMFSLRTYHDGVEVSIHYLLWDVAERVCALQRINTTTESNAFDFLIDFRPNTSASLVKHGGNPLQDLKSLKHAVYVPTFQEICYQHSSNIAGYISQSPIGGKLHVEGQETYFIGIIPFYLLVLPKILLDKRGKLARNIDTLRNNIREIMQDNIPKYINIADPRMTKEALECVKKSFVKNNRFFHGEVKQKK